MFFKRSIAGFIEEAEFTLTKAGKLKLTYENYQFYKHSRFSGKTFWRCEKYKAHKCTCKAYTFTVGPKELVKVKGVHSHEPGI